MTGDRARRLTGCFIKFPLGCGAFLAGAGVVTVLFLPQAFGRVAAENLEQAFDRTYAGHLQVGEARMPSVFDAQRLDDVSIEDPGGEEVLRGRWTGPPLRDLFARRGRTSLDLGRLTLFQLRIVEDEGGRTNLHEAFAPRDPDGGLTLEIHDEVLRIGSGSSTWARLDGFEEYALDLEVERLSWSTPGTRARGSNVLVRNVRGRYSLSADKGSRLVVEGRIEAERDGSIKATLVQDRPGGPRRSLELEGEGLSLATLGDLFALDFETPFGSRAERFLFHSEPSGPDREQLLLELESEAGELHLQGTLDGRAEELSGERGITLKHVEPRPFWTSLFFGEGGLVRALHVQPEAPEGRWRAEIESYVLPLDRDGRRLSAVLDLELEGVRVNLAPPLARALGASAAQAFPVREMALSLRIEEGRVHYEDVVIPVGDETLTLRGWHDLPTGAVHLEVVAPGAWDHAPVTARGTWDELELVDG